MIAGFHLTYFTLYCAAADDLDDTGCARSKRYLCVESKEGGRRRGIVLDVECWKGRSGVFQKFHAIHDGFLGFCVLHVKEHDPIGRIVRVRVRIVYLSI